MELMTPHIGTMFWTTVTFILLLVVLRKFAWWPILNTLEERERRIEDSLDKADDIDKREQEIEEERKQKIKEAEKESEKILDSARRQGQAARDDILQKARQDADELVNRAKKEIDAAREQAVEDVQRIAVDVAMSATEKLIKKNINKEEHQKMIKESLKNLENLS